MNRLAQLWGELKRLWSTYVSTAHTSALDKVLLFLIVGCVVILFAHDILPRFVGWHELLSGGAELWDLLYELCLAIVASYTFYFVVVHLKTQRDREILKPFLYGYTNSIVEDAKLISRKLAQASQTNFNGDFPPSSDITVTMCTSVDHMSIVPNMLIVRWFELLEIPGRLTKESSANIYTAAPFLQPDHLKRVIDVDTCTYFKRVETFANTFRRPDESSASTDRHEDLGVLANDFHDYFENVKRLEEYMDRELS